MKSAPSSRKKDYLDINRILRADPVNCKYGAPLGQRNLVGYLADLYLQRVRWVDGDYSPDGTYWGHGTKSSMWVAFNGPQDPDYQPAFGTRIWVRARTRKEAAREVRRLYPTAKFVKEPR